MSFSLCNEEYWTRKRKDLPPEYQAELFAEADRILEEPELSVTFKTVPPLSGNPHDYDQPFPLRLAQSGHPGRPAVDQARRCHQSGLREV